MNKWECEFCDHTTWSEVKNNTCPECGKLKRWPDKRFEFENGAYEAQKIAKNLGLSMWLRSTHKWVLTDKAYYLFLELGKKYKNQLDIIHTRHQKEKQKLSDKIEKQALQILKDLKGNGQEGGIESSREEVTGLGGATKNKNFCNSGFGGGSMMRLATAHRVNFVGTGDLWKTMT